MSQEDRPLRRGWTTGTCADRGGQGGLHGAVDRRISRSGRGDAAARRAAELRAGARREGTRGSATAGRHQGRGRRSRCDPWRARPGDGARRRARQRRHVPRRRGRRHGHAARSSAAARRAGDQSGAAAHDRRRHRRSRAPPAGCAADADVEIAIPGGEALAAKTLNGRLGIVGGLSILGTTGIVVPYSCAAWIHSIHRGIDVARAAGLTHVAGSTGASSEAGAQKLYGLPEIALIDMGDFVGGMLKYLRTHPVPRVTIAGGVGKMTKLAQGLTRPALQARRGRSGRCLRALAQVAGGSAELRARIMTANTAAEAFALARSEASRSATRLRRSASRRRSGWSKAAASRSRSRCSTATALVGRAPFRAA